MGRSGLMGAILAALASAGTVFADERLAEHLDPLVPDGRAAEVAVWIDGDRQSATLNVAAADDRRFFLASTAKAILSVALMQLHETGTINIDGPIEPWLSQEVIDHVDGTLRVTIAQLLTMRSGLPEYLTAEFYEAWIAQEAETRTPKAALAFAADQSATFEPGTEFEYNNTNYVLAQLILEEASGMTMADYFENRIFSVAGMDETDLLGFGANESDLLPGFEDVDNDGRPVNVSPFYTGEGFGDGGLVTRAGDVVAFYKALLIDKNLLGEAALKRLLTPGPEDDYAMGLVVVGQSGQRIIGHGGAFSGFVSSAVYFEEDNAIAAALIADSEGDPDELVDAAIDFLIE